MPTRFVFLILPHIHILDLAGADQAIHEAMDYKADFLLEFCGIGENVMTTSGLPFGEVPHFSNQKLETGDFLLIPGSSYAYLTSAAFLKNRSLFDWINKQYEAGVNIGSICMGAFVLAESGLLDGKTCTTHFKKTKELQEAYPKIKVVENILFTDSNGIYTSAGIVSGIDMILHIIEKLKDGHFAHLVARELVIYNRRNGQDAQLSNFLKFRNHIHNGIHKAQDFIVENIQSKLMLTDLALVANMSERSFTRIFKKETAITVNEYITNVRVAMASELMKNPDLSKTTIANRVGLKSERQLSRILQGN